MKSLMKIIGVAFSGALMIAMSLPFFLFFALGFVFMGFYIILCLVIVSATRLFLADRLNEWSHQLDRYLETLGITKEEVRRVKAQEGGFLPMFFLILGLVSVLSFYIVDSNKLILLSDNTQWFHILVGFNTMAASFGGGFVFGLVALNVYLYFFKRRVFLVALSKGFNEMSVFNPKREGDVSVTWKAGVVPISISSRAKGIFYVGDSVHQMVFVFSALFRYFIFAFTQHYLAWM